MIDHSLLYLSPHPNLLLERLATRLSCDTSTAKALVIPEGEGISPNMDLYYLMSSLLRTR